MRFAGALAHWIDRNILELGRELRIEYLPPLMVYAAYGISGLTGIVGTFFVKEYLGLSAHFLAALGFWIGIPWALKMPMGHVVDLIWRWKSAIVYLGAALIAAGLLIMIGLISHTEAMRAVMPAEHWYVIAALLSPLGYVLQDVVADAMTVEAVPRFDKHGVPIDEERRKLMHTTMQTLGRVAIIGGLVLVALANVWLFQGVELLTQAAKADKYAEIYTLALVIPLVSVLGTVLASVLRRRRTRQLIARGFTREQADAMIEEPHEPPSPNWWILGGSVAFGAFSVGTGLSNLPYAQELIFGGSMAIVLFLMSRLLRELDPEARETLVATAVVIFIFRAMPSPGDGASWWMIDVLRFDQSFLAKLSLITSVLTLFGMFIFRRFMAEHSIAYVVGFLTVVGTLLALPYIGMYYGLHEWTAVHTGGFADARFIAVINTALESPFGQISMIPMLAWIARSAPASLKATFFAVMASFTNLALSAGQLGTKYLNAIYTVSREVKDPVSKIVTVPQNYTELGHLLIGAALIGFVLPMVTVAVVKLAKLRTA
jgi:hypothetical protein